MAVSSDIDVANQALLLLGENTISSFTDGTDVSSSLAILYPTHRDAMLAIHPWRFAMAKANLARLTASPLNEWQYAFQLPGRVWEIDGGPWAVYNSGQIGAHPIQEFEIFGTELAADFEEIWIDYKFRPPENRWPAWFVNLVAMSLAAKISPSVTDIVSLTEEWNARAWGTPQENWMGGYFLVCTNLNARTSPPIQIQDFNLVDARFS